MQSDRQFAHMKKKILYLALLMIFFGGGCASRRQSKTVVSAPLGQPKEPERAQASLGGESPVLLVTSPGQKQERPAPVNAVDPLQFFLSASLQSLDEADQLFESGDRESSKQMLSDLTIRLRGSEFDFASHPEVEKVYHTTSDRLHTLKVGELVESTDGFLSEVVPTLLDELTKHNIFSLEVESSLGEKVIGKLKADRFDIPMVVNRRVLQFLDYYQGPGRKITEIGLKRSGRYMKYCKEVFSKEGVPLDLIFLAHVESLFNPKAYSRAHAAGTARMYDLKVDWWIDERRNVELATVAAARHLRDLHGRFGDWFLALAAYNAGPGRVARNLRRYGEMDYWTMVRRRLLPRDTRNYVPAILAAIIIYKNPEEYGFYVTQDEPLVSESVSVEHQYDLRVLAEELGLEGRVLKELNPELRRGIIPPLTRPYPLKIPVGLVDQAMERMAAIPASKRLRLDHHRVARGDTLWDIARLYDTSVQAIAVTNRLSNPNRLRLGQELLIPKRDGRSATRRSVAIPSGSYTVSRGDSLYKIARSFGISVDRLAQINNLEKARKIYPGQKLRVH